jgi:hypothetical protein
VANISSKAENGWKSERFLRMRNDEAGLRNRRLA